MDPTPRYLAFLFCSVLLVGLAVQTSDLATIRQNESNGDPRFEYPVLARALYVAERAVAPSRTGIALANAAVGVAAAVGVTVLLRRNGGDARLWMTAPTLILIGVNVDAVTGLLGLLAVVSWKRGKPAVAGLWIGLGAAFKLAPVVLLFPLLGAADRRAAVRLAGTAAVIWLAVNLPYALADPDGWRFPYVTSSLRPAALGTVWAALGLNVRATNLAAAGSLTALGTAIALAVRGRTIRPETGAALALLALLATSKLWQAHFLLWALPLLALVRAPAWPVRMLEVLNLAYFVVLWCQFPPETDPLWIWPVSAARLAALGWVAFDLIRRDRRA